MGKFVRIVGKAAVTSAEAPHGLRLIPPLLIMSYSCLSSHLITPAFSSSQHYLQSTRIHSVVRNHFRMFFLSKWYWCNIFVHVNNIRPFLNLPNNLWLCIIFNKILFVRDSRVEGLCDCSSDQTLGFILMKTISQVHWRKISVKFINGRNRSKNHFKYLKNGMS